MFKDTIDFIRSLYQTDDFIPLHEPRFSDQEKKLVLECIDSTFVSSVGKFVDQFERDIEAYTGAKHAVAVVNGTQALFVALQLSGVQRDTEVLTQSLSFIATANAIHYTGAEPIFLDVDKDTLGLSPKALQIFFEQKTVQKEDKCWNKKTGKEISACVPMHTFGHPCRIEQIAKLCKAFNVTLVEDAAESMGSIVSKKHTGLFGKLGILSFNGNKIITTGAGGMIITDDNYLAKKAKHLTTTAKVPHPWEFIHDEIGYNFRMPNLNAALGVAQLKNLSGFISKKRILAKKYEVFFKDKKFYFIQKPENCKSNYWLNAIQLNNFEERDLFLKETNEQGIMTRTIWRPSHLLPMYQHCQTDNLLNTQFLYERIVNIPSSVMPN
jgi:perosamine synthetase